MKAEFVELIRESSDEEKIVKIIKSSMEGPNQSFKDEKGKKYQGATFDDIKDSFKSAGVKLPKGAKTSVALQAMARKLGMKIGTESYVKRGGRGKDLNIWVIR